MAKQTLPWSELKAGLLVAVALIILGVAIFSVGGKGRIFSDNYTLTTRFPRVLGLKPAAPVWLEGVEIGSVTAVMFVKDEASTKPAIDVSMLIGDEFKHLIRADSTASIDGKGLLGDKIVQISVGSHTAAILEDGGRITGLPPADFSVLMNEATSTLHDLSEITNNVRSLTQSIDEGKGTVGKFVKDHSLYDSLALTAKNLADLTGRLGKSNGSLAKFMNDPKLYDETTALIHELRKGEGTLAKLIQDPALFDDTKGTLAKTQAMIARIDGMMARTEKGEGNAGKLLYDDELYKSLTTTVNDLKALIADIKENPGKYVKVSVF